MTPEQCKMARVGLGLSVRELAEKSDGKIGQASVRNYEGENTVKKPAQKTVDAIRATLESLGAIFPPHTEQGQAVIVPIKEPAQIDLEDLTAKQ